MAGAAAEEVRIGSREEERFAVGAVVEAQGRPGRFLLQVDDLSLTGARIRCPAHRLIPGDWLLLDLSLAPQRACVVWADGMMAGCEFAEPLQPVVLRIMLKALIPKPEAHESEQRGNSTSAGTCLRTAGHDESACRSPYIPEQIYPPRNRNFRL